MSQLTEQPSPPTTSDTDLMTAVRRVLESSAEPLTLSKIRSALPASFRTLSLEALAEALQRQVAANVLVQYPKYRSPQDRYWDRPMRVHVAQLLRTALEGGPLAASELRRKLPDYAKTQAEAVLEEEVAQGRLHRHPPVNSRGGPRFGAEAPDPKTFLSAELSTLFGRLERLGFTQARLRQAALELLHDEEWAPTPMASPEATASAPSTQPPAAPAATGQSMPGQGYQWSEERTHAPEAAGQAQPPQASPAAPSPQNRPS